jgi:hypothetical protein
MHWITDGAMMPTLVYVAFRGADAIEVAGKAA